MFTLNKVLSSLRDLTVVAVDPSQVSGRFVFTNLPPVPVSPMEFPSSLSCTIFLKIISNFGATDNSLLSVALSFLLFRSAGSGAGAAATAAAEELIDSSVLRSTKLSFLSKNDMLTAKNQIKSNATQLLRSN